jgi:hypothetical protein
MANRLTEFAHAMFLDPVDCFDHFGCPLAIRAMPEHVRLAIASYEMDPVSFVTKIKFVDKLTAIIQYSKLAGDIPREKSPPLPPTSTSRYNLSKLTDEEFKEHLRLREKALIYTDEGERKDA